MKKRYQCKKNLFQSKERVVGRGDFDGYSGVEELVHLLKQAERVKDKEYACYFLLQRTETPHVLPS